MSVKKGSVPDAIENVESGAEPTGGMTEGERIEMTRRILFKLDTRVLPVLALLFLCSMLDRTNVGNAKIIGLEKDLNISNSQFNQGLAVFYATYIASEVPSNLVLKKISPKIWLPSLTVIWGIITMCIGFVKNFEGFVVVRSVLGLAEGGLLPGIILYISGLYTRGELALRVGLFYCASSISGAFGGLLARGLSTIGPRGGLEGWRWILIIEGLMTVCCGIIAYLVLPKTVQDASFLSQDERDYAVQRLSGYPLAEKERFNVLHEQEESFRWSEVKRGIFDLQVWLTATAYFGILAGLYSFGLFIPTIINALNIAKSANEVQLWSVIPYAVATPITVFIALLSDRLGIRGIIMLFTLPVAIIGYAVIANVESAKVKFGMTCLMATGVYSTVPCILVWNSNNSAGHYKRATTSGLQLAIANCAGFVATFIYPSIEGPSYHKGHSIVLGLLVYAWLMLVTLQYLRGITDKSGFF